MPDKADAAASVALRQGKLPVRRLDAFAAGYRQAMRDIASAPVVTEGVPPDLVLELLSRATGERRGGEDGKRPRRCRYCGAGFLGNCGAYGAEIPREQCPHSGKGGGDGE